MYAVNPKNPSPRAVPLNSSSPVTRTRSPGNSSATALQVPTTASKSGTIKVIWGSMMKERRKLNVLATCVFFHLKKKSVD